MAENRFVWSTEDIENAFDNVRRETLMEVVDKYVHSPKLVNLIRSMVFVDSQKSGIRQGAPLSPFLLNLFLYHHLEKPWHKQGVATPMIRYADDILLLCKTQKEARIVRGKVQSLLEKTGLCLKNGSQASMVDLRKGDSAFWLGHRFRKGPQGLQVKIADKSWNQLRNNLEKCHEKPDSPFLAIQTINGWIDRHGPCYEFEKPPRVFARILKDASECGFDEIPSNDALSFHWKQAYFRWQGYKSTTTNQGAILLNDPAKEEPTVGLAVDAAWSEKKQEMEYQGVWLDSGEIAFQSDLFPSGNNNIGEYLAIIQGLKLLKRKGLDCPIYSDSWVALSWLKNQRI